MKVIAVIGANYGDEGKGLMTDYLCSVSQNPVVVRHNGGAQAGHTVELVDGRRHVFNHIGSGHFRGAPTYLSEHFIANPRIFLNEVERLGERPVVTIHPEAMVTTPFDVAVNQFVEKLRKGERHGTCGCGVGATVDRHHRWPHCSTRVATLDQMSDVGLKAHLHKIERHTKDLHGDEKFLPDDCSSMIKTFIDDFRQFRSMVEIRRSYEYLQSFESVIFEGAQGLGLCQSRYHSSPHVTRSFTGTKNVAAICEKADLGRYDVIYVSRWFETRHGEGPMDHEAGFNISGVDDLTNTSNEWQGILRYGVLDLDSLTSRIDSDLHPGMRRRHLAFTHMDEKKQFLFFQKGLLRFGRQEFLEAAAQILGPLWLVYGKRAEDVSPSCWR